MDVTADTGIPVWFRVFVFFTFGSIACSISGMPTIPSIRNFSSV